MSSELNEVEADTGGQAFPSTYSGGMSLLDYFAAQAMQSLLSYSLPHDPFTDGQIAQIAYAVAEEMVKRERMREKQS